ncbi:hypothetical protein PUNSTDRAFT_107299 [Punctularia strigosozonata HHB-11173 SS5]|uniref:uncharacterized protein n=1 Tax=Punctularia strigosozonata (strain HHB-11173) TaxID=741275 RepID=UPI0004417086|nr:uncharacterized protein PUNSTDRAFT_107299 [Punctularia strigosozonata HHB-11173 SS5]EIN05597.1 hypothetical protein PUNSTDRAFT_107299 [Punctularia strigosozonata HHB-11173 SS5]
MRPHSTLSESDQPSSRHHMLRHSCAGPTRRADEGVDLHWLDGSAPSSTPAGTAFGLPWSQGEIDRTTALAATTSSGGIPLQSWPLAYWPDGSLKWTGHALAADSGLTDSVHVAPGTPTEPADPVSVKQTGSTITVTAGSFTATFNKHGSTLIQTLALSSSQKAHSGTLVAHVQSAPDEPELAGSKPSVQALTGNIEAVTVEQDGPVRAVIKITGKYSGGGHKAFLPFISRFYVTAGSTAVRLVHFFIYDGDQNADFIKGIGLQFAVPLSDPLYSRHVLFSTATGGLFAEPVRVLSGLRVDATAAVLAPQFNGQPVPDSSTWPATVQNEVGMLPVWADFSLDQLSSEHFEISKRQPRYPRTNAGRKVTFLSSPTGNSAAASGTRASGVGFLGGASAGGVLFAFKDFWQGAPRSIDVRSAGGDSQNNGGTGNTDDATVTLWAYSPKAPAMDMRSYDTVAHGLDLTYEDVGDPDPNPTGVGRSYEVTLQILPAVPSRDSVATLGKDNVATTQLVASPEFYASMHLFGGRWNVPDTSNATLAAVEARKSALLDFYVQEVEQRQWYGFWNYGDVMHTYDQTRHVWRYDVGGYAWDNAELGTDLWLWMSFLRTGRADVFKLAHAMTRHLSEVDFHHIGPFAGLGSRHHVTQWGDGAKETRMSASTLKRPFYYLTTDELIGDLMDFSLQADQTVVTWEPLRKVDTGFPFTTPGRLRIGPDWTALCGNWFVKWERTNDAKWLDRMKTGMASALNDIAGFQYGLFQGYTAAVGWDPATAHLTPLGGSLTATYHLSMVFGGGEMLIELMDLIGDQVPKFDAVWVDFCRYYNASAADKIAKYGQNFNSGGFTQWYMKLQAYAGERLNDTSLQQAAWTILVNNKVGVWAPVQSIGGSDVVNPIQEIPNLATNDSAGLSLAEYAVVAIAPTLAPASFTSASAESADEKVKEKSNWDTSTLGGISTDGDGKTKMTKGKRGIRAILKKAVCLQ